MRFYLILSKDIKNYMNYEINNYLGDKKNKEYKVILENNNLNFLYKENKINVKVIYRKRRLFLLE